MHEVTTLNATGSGKHTRTHTQARTHDARTHAYARTHARANTHTHTHTHTQTHTHTLYTARAEMGALSLGTSHVSAVKYVDHFGGYSKKRCKKIVTHAESQASALSLLSRERRIALYKSSQQQHSEHVVPYIST